jgi:hypothetical protein
MSKIEANKRYQIVSFRSKSLENNPINSPVERQLAVYLPPDYFESLEKMYPVIYFIHGYTGNINNLSITPRWNDNKNLPLDLIPPEVLKMLDLDNIPSYIKFDDLILEGKWPAFIFVQPDASLYLPHYLGHKELTGVVKTKGSFYINSPFTGNFADFVAKDVIDYIDSNYRTIPDKQHRTLMGTSMGGYGTIFLSLNYPEKFIAAASLSPANISIQLLDWKMITPLNEILYGKEEAIKQGEASLGDIFDTFDAITSKNNPLISSIKRDANGKVVKLDKKASKNWQKYDLDTVIKENPESFKKVHLLLNCHKKDEYGFAEETKKLHETLVKYSIDHECDIYQDFRAKLAPHMLGNAYKILPGVSFCAQHFT